MSLINALVLFVGTQAIAYIHSKGSTPSASTIAYTAHMDIFQHLLVDLDTEGKSKSLLQGGCYPEFMCAYHLRHSFVDRFRVFNSV